ncbi:hypothetical protein G7Y89_g12460 [Cudoniella acicularis]|uniref:Uncharacterized protein n=1 Tax=Cudoniella acicularis TaxID=354080 RepID=A0A8H4RBD5_9HELO|nr:hypothetical protein G7Y89_g12460 [Cudoniella acicularis]
MSSTTLTLLHGQLNSSHTSNITAIYTPSNLPTPWPLVIASCVVSLIICCYGTKGALSILSSLSLENRPRSTKALWKRTAPRRRESHICETELHTLHTDDAPPEYTIVVKDVESPPQEILPSVNPDDITPMVVEPDYTSRWDKTPRSKLIFIVIIIYCTFRAATATAVTLQSYLTHNTSVAAPCLLFFALVSTQFILTNLSLPRLMRLLLTLDVLLLFLAFLATSFIPYTKNGDNLPFYAHITTLGGNCPVYASDCYNQAPHWSTFGCGKWTPLQDVDGDDDARPGNGYYPPYASKDDFNYYSNPIHIIESIIIVFGSIWLLSVVFQLWEARHLFRGSHAPRPGRSANAMYGLMIIFVEIDSKSEAEEAGIQASGRALTDFE